MCRRHWAERLHGSTLLMASGKLIERELLQVLWITAAHAGQIGRAHV